MPRHRKPPRFGKLREEAQVAPAQAYGSAGPDLDIRVRVGSTPPPRAERWIGSAAFWAERRTLIGMSGPDSGMCVRSVNSRAAPLLESPWSRQSII